MLNVDRRVRGLAWLSCVAVTALSLSSHAENAAPPEVNPPEVNPPEAEPPEVKTPEADSPHANGSDRASSIPPHLAPHAALLITTDAGGFGSTSGGGGTSGGALVDDSGPLIRARFNQVNDALGFRWDIDQQGGVQDGLNDCFDGGLSLRVNGNQFQCNDPKMTGDGEYVLGGQVGALQITRRIRLDAQRGGARYIEVITNPDKRDVVAEVAIVSQLGDQAANVVTSSGRPLGGGELGKDDLGIVAVSQAGNSRPSVLFLLTDGRTKDKPRITINNNREINVRYTVSLKPGATAAIYHIVAQRNSGSGGTATQQLFEPFYKRRHLDPRVPKSLAKAIVNVRIGSGTIEGQRLTQAVADVADEAGVERGEHDVLVVGEDAALTGEVTCGKLTIQTTFGATDVAWDDVALFVGGRGVGSPMRLHLRSGEILRGPVTATNMSLASTQGLTMPLDPAQINLLLGRQQAIDDHPHRDAGAFVTTAAGDRLAVRHDDNAPLRTVTAWGALAVAMTDVASLELVGEPQPNHVLCLADGTRLTVMLGGGSLQLQSIRFGQIALPPYAVASLVRLRQLPDGEDAQESMAAQIERQRLAVEHSPRVRLVGENTIVGTLSAPSLTVLSPLGATPIDVAALQSIERNDDANDVNFTVTLRGGGQVSGRIEQRMLAIHGTHRDWLVPTEHIVEVAGLSPDSDPPATTASAAPQTLEDRIEALMRQREQLAQRHAQATQSSDSTAAQAVLVEIRDTQRQMNKLRAELARQPARNAQP